jgi:ATP-dependent Clp protease ATP-binding subunit ClpA
MSTPDASVDDIFHPNGTLRLDLLSATAGQAVQEAVRLGRETRWETLRSPHLFMGLLAVADDGIRNWGDRLHADLPRLLEQFRDLFHQDEGDPEPVLVMHREFFSDNAIRLLRDAYGRALDHSRPFMTSMDLLISLLTAPNSIVAECFERIGVTPAKLTELAVLAEHFTRRA